MTWRPAHTPVTVLGPFQRSDSALANNTMLTFPTSLPLNPQLLSRSFLQSCNITTCLSATASKWLPSFASLAARMPFLLLLNSFLTPLLSHEKILLGVVTVRWCSEGKWNSTGDRELDDTIVGSSRKFCGITMLTSIGMSSRCRKNVFDDFLRLNC